MAGEADQRGAGGQESGGSPDAGEGKVEPPKPEGGDKPPEGTEERRISAEVLPPELRDRPEAEIKFLMGHLTSSLASRNQEVDTLKNELAELRGEVRSRPPAEPPEPDPDDDKPMEELILEDADKALSKWLKKRGLLDRFESLDQRVGEAEFALVSRQLPDFENYEEDVKGMLARSKIPATKANIIGAYKIVRGERAIEEEEKKKRETTSVPPTPPTPPEGDKGGSPELSDLEKEVMRAHGMDPGREEDVKKWTDSRDKPMEVRLPS